MPGDMGIMDPSDHTAECALPRLHDGQCANVPPAPPFGEPDKPVTRCEATYGTTEYRCTGAAGHADDHTAYSATVGDLEWSDADNAVKLPQREPGAALNCTSVSAHGDMCTLTRDHDGMHERHEFGERLASWETTYDAPRCESTAPSNPTVRCAQPTGHGGYHWPESQASSGVIRWTDTPDDHDALSRELFDGVPSAPRRFKLTALDSQPVRVRFVDLPHRHTAVDGPLHRHPVHIAEPGGFALVVDRFRDAGHRGSELTRWELFGAAIGAHTVLCYPGELDIVGWLDGS